MGLEEKVLISISRGDRGGRERRKHGEIRNNLKKGGRGISRDDTDEEERAVTTSAKDR